MVQTTKTNVLICVPTIDRALPPKLAEALKKTKYPVAYVHNQPQALARTMLVSQMMEGPYDYLFFIDSDMSPHIPLDTIIDRFIDADKKVVSALTSTKGMNHQLLLFQKNPHITYPMLNENLYEEDKLIEVFAIGFGACLIHRSVFEEIALPWFKTNWEYIVPETQEMRVVGGLNMGADFYFSLQCQRYGIPLHLDCGVLVHHMEMDAESSYINHEFPWDEVMEMRKKGVPVYGR